MEASYSGACMRWTCSVWGRVGVGIHSVLHASAILFDSSTCTATDAADRIGMHVMP
jgi:hypothetical protein